MRGQVVVSDVVWAETGAAFSDISLFERAMKELSISPIVTHVIILI